MLLVVVIDVSTVGAIDLINQSLSVPRFVFVFDRWLSATDVL